MSKENSLFNRIQDILEIQRKDIFDKKVTTRISPSHIDTRVSDITLAMDRIHNERINYFKGIECVVDQWGILPEGSDHVMVISEKLHEKINNEK